MRVGIISYDFFPFEGGQGRHISEILKRFEGNSNFEFIVISPSKNELKNHVQFFHITKRFGNNILFSFFINIFLNKLIKKYNINIIHLHGGPGGIFFWKRLNIPVIYTAHHTYAQQYRLITDQKWKWIFSKIEPIGYKLADKIITVSNSTRNILVKNYKINLKKIEEISNGVDTEVFYNMGKIKKIKNSILFVGRLDERKGIDFLVRSIPYVIKEIPDIKLFVVGKGKLRKNLEEFVKDYNLQSHINFLGFIPDEDLPNCYNRVEVVIIPSIFEGFGITVIEAMSCETPVIGTNVPGINDIIQNGENGILVPSKDSKELAIAVIKLLHDEKLREFLGKNGRKLVLERYNWGKIAEKMIEVYEEVNK